MLEQDADLEKYDLPAAASLVDISSNALTCLPQALLSLGALQKLNASHNQLSALVPSGLWFPKLKVSSPARHRPLKHCMHKCHQLLVSCRCSIWTETTSDSYRL